MRRPQALAQPAAIDYFGGLKPTGVLGADAFRSHDASKAWEDGGQAMAISEELVASIAQAMQHYGAEQARDAVADYGSDAWADMAMIDGRVCVAIDLSNTESQFRVYWSLEELLARVAQEAIEKGAEDMLNGIYEACSRASLMLQATPAPEPVAAPVRQVTNGVRGGKPAMRAAVPQVRRGIPTRG